MFQFKLMKNRGFSLCLDPSLSASILCEKLIPKPTDIATCHSCQRLNCTMCKSTSFSSWLQNDDHPLTIPCYVKYKPNTSNRTMIGIVQDLLPCDWSPSNKDQRKKPEITCRLKQPPANIQIHLWNPHWHKCYVVLMHNLKYNTVSHKLQLKILNMVTYVLFIKFAIAYL
jgi:hypothetical protein